MADRFPLIVNSISKKIEELASADNLDLTGNGIVIAGDTGAGKYLASNGTNLIWDIPGDVFLTQTQTLSNKTFQNAIISGLTNTISDISNGSLVNSSVTINGQSVSLGGSVTISDTNTLYSVSAADGINESEKIIRLSSNDSTPVTDDVIIAVSGPASIPTGSKALNLAISRTDDTISISGTVVDSDTITTLTAPGGTAVSGAVSFAATGAASVSQSGSVITVSAQDTDSITKIRVGSGGTYLPTADTESKFTFLQSGATTISQAENETTGDPEITISSDDTVTRIRGGTSSTFLPTNTGTNNTDITIAGGSSGNVTVSQSGNTINIDSTDTNTVTRLAANAGGTLVPGDFRFTSSGATTITATTDAGVTTFDISSENDDTGASLTASKGIVLSTSDFQLKNADNLTGNKLTRWDSSNKQFINSIIEDNGSVVTIGGNLSVIGTTTTIDSTTIRVSDNIIELRKGTSISGADGGVQVNRTTDQNGNVVLFQRVEWFESGGYWRTYDGSISKRFVTEVDTQTLSNKTLESPTLNSPNIGAATATSINGLAISSTASSTLTFTDEKTLTVQRSIVLTSNQNNATVTANFRGGGDVVYTNDPLSALNTTSANQLRGVISETTGSGSLVFQDNPSITTGFTTSSTGLVLFNSTATSVTAFGAATQIVVGETNGSGKTTVNHSGHIKVDLEVGTVNESDVASNGDVLIRGILDCTHADMRIRGGDTDPISIGRGANAVSTNTRLGVSCLDNVSSGSQNTAIGYKALLSVNIGAANTAVGNRALNQTGVGGGNVAIGRDTMLSNTSGNKNVAVGNNACTSNQAGEANVCIGHYAGYSVTGTGNVVIGPADTEDSSSVTYSLDNVAGDRQLVIGSGQNAWIKGNNQFNITIPNDLRVDGDALIQGSLTVNGTVTSINSNTISVDDKNIELAAVVNVTFSATTLDGSVNITGITPTTGLIPGMEVISQTGGITIPTGTIIVSINGNQAELSNSVSGTGQATIVAQGPADLAANGGGLILKGTPVNAGGTGDKTILYDHSRTDKYWTFSENLEIAFGKKFVIGNQLALNSTTLGATVVNSSLTSVGVLVGAPGAPALEVDGASVLGGRIIEKTFGSWSQDLSITNNIASVTTAGANTICARTDNQNLAINTWNFSTADSDGNTLVNGQSITITLVIDASTASTYGDGCSVDGTPITNGIEWSGGSPPQSSSNTDILTFIIVKDGSGVTRVFGQGNTDFS